MPHQTAGPGRSALYRGSTVASPRPPKAVAWGLPRLRPVPNYRDRARRNQKPTITKIAALDPYAVTLAMAVRRTFSPACAPDVQARRRRARRLASGKLVPVPTQA